MTERKVSVERNTLETQIKATINLDGTGGDVLPLVCLLWNTCWIKLRAMV